MTVANIHHKGVRESIDGENVILVDRSTAWGNPYTIGKDGTREECVYLYMLWALGQPVLLDNLWRLRGKTLVCHCHPKPCHAHILERLALTKLGKRPRMPIADPREPVHTAKASTRRRQRT